MKTIGILIHREQPVEHMTAYVIHYLAKIWLRMGFDVHYLKGFPSQPPPVDLLIVHVDLSVVPDAYLEYAANFPVILNGKIPDIRKSTISKNLVKPDDGYTGRVVIKSNLNCGGAPELRILGQAPPAFTNADQDHLPRGYRIYDSPEQVPEMFFYDPNWVVERFLPEVENGLYHIRFCSFLGGRWNCARRCSSSPILTGENCLEKREVIEPHPDILAIRRELGFDYGKFDYVVHDDKAVLIDANKTIGAGTQAFMEDPSLMKAREYLAEGIEDYF